MAKQFLAVYLKKGITNTEIPSGSMGLLHADVERATGLVDPSAFINIERDKTGWTYGPMQKEVDLKALGQRLSKYPFFDSVGTVFGLEHSD